LHSPSTKVTTGCGMLRAGGCINCAEKTAALILESSPGAVLLPLGSGEAETGDARGRDSGIREELARG